MKHSNKETVTVVVEIEVSFHKYDTARLNTKAKAQIRKALKSIVRDNITYVSFYVEDDENGSAIEDCSQIAKIKFS